MDRRNHFARFSIGPAWWPIALALVCSLLLGAGGASAAEEDKPITIAEVKHAGKVDFEKEILPILQKNCTACHNATKAESSLVLETPQSIAKGGDEGPAVVAGKGGESLLLKLASRQRESFMPPADNEVGAQPLTPEQLGLIKLWIDQGATGQVASASAKFEWQPLAAEVHPIYAVAISDHGEWIAASRANQIFLYHAQGDLRYGELTDPNLVGSTVYRKPGVAHQDMVQSLAFSPTGDRLASGGYRTVKIWKRSEPPEPQQVTVPRQPYTSIAASPDRKWLALGTASGDIYLVDTKLAKSAKTLAAHKQQVASVAFSSDGKQLLSGGYDKRLILWNVATGKPAGELLSPTEIEAVAFVAQNKQVATAGRDKLIHLWELPTLSDQKPAQPADEKADSKQEAAQPVRSLAGHSATIRSLVAMPQDPNILFSGSDDATMRSWDVASGRMVRQFSHGVAVESIQLSADGERAVSVGKDQFAKLWNTSDGKLVSDLKGNFQASYELADTKQALQLAGQLEKNAKTDLDAAKKRKTSEEANSKKADMALQKAQEELKKKKMAAEKAIADKEAADKKLEAARKELAAKKKLLDDARQRHNQATEGVKQATDALAKAKVEKEKQKALADAATAKEKQAKDASVMKEAAFKQVEAALQKAQEEFNKQSTAAEKVAADIEAAKKKLEDVKKEVAAKGKDRDDARQFHKQTVAEAKQAADALAGAELAEKKRQASADIAVATENNEKGAVAQSDAAYKQAETAVRQAEAREKQLETPWKRATGELRAAERIEEASKLAGEQAKIAVEKATAAISAAEQSLSAAQTHVKTTQQQVADQEKALPAVDKPVRYAAFSPSSKELVTVGDDHAVHLWSARSGAAIIISKPHSEVWQQALWLSPEKIVVCDQKGTVQIQSMRPKWVLDRIIGGDDSSSPIVDRVTAIDFSSDGKLLVTGGGQASRTGELKIWNVQTGSLVREIMDPHSDTLFDVRFSPDDSMIASCSADRYMKIFDVETGDLKRAFEGHTGHVLSVSWRADQRLLATAGADNEIRVWDLNTGQQRRSIRGFNKEITSLDFLDNQDRFVASCADAQVFVRTSSGGGGPRLNGPTDFIYRARASRDGKYVVAGGEKGIVWFWSSDGKLSRNYPPPRKADSAD